MVDSIPFEIQSNKTSAELEGLRAFRSIRTLAESGELPDLTLDEINKSKYETPDRNEHRSRSFIHSQCRDM